MEDMTNGNNTTAAQEEVEEQMEQEQTEAVADVAVGQKRQSVAESEDASSDKEGDQPPVKKGKVDEMAKLWEAINENLKDFQAWTNLLQYVDQQSELDGGREAYTAFFARYPYCYGYWKKFADLEKRKGTKETTLQVFEKGLAAIPLSVDLWVHYLDYIVNTYTEESEESFVRQQFERAVHACGLEFRSDKMWDAFVNWEGNNKRWQRVTAVYDKLLATPVAKYTQHWNKFQDHIKKHPVTEVITVEEFLSLQRSLNSSSKSATDAEATEDEPADVDEAPPGVEEDAAADSAAAATKDDTPAAAAGVTTASEEESKSIQQLVLSKREKLYQATTEEVKLRWSYEDAIKRPYFHVKSLERSQLQAWRDYLEFEVKQGDEQRTRVLFERCLIAAALYEEFWMRYVHYLETLESVKPEEMRSVYERACTIHLKEKVKPQLRWALFEEESGNPERALELLTEVQERLPELLEPWIQQASLERRRGRLEAAEAVFTKAIQSYKDKNESTLTISHAYLLVMYSRFIVAFLRDTEKSIELLHNIIVEKTSAEENKINGEEMRAVEIIMWSVIERCMSLTPPDLKRAYDVFKIGMKEPFMSNTRLAFANRRHQCILEFGSSDDSLLEIEKELRILQQELRSQDDMCSGSEKNGLDDGDARKDKKGKGDRTQSSGQQSGQLQSASQGQQNGGYYGTGSQAYSPSSAAGGNYQQYPQQGGSAPSHQQPPPQHPPPPQGGQQNYGGGYNQNYQQGTYPQQQYQSWGYPQGNYGYNQQQWSGYSNYYGQR